MSLKSKKTEPETAISSNAISDHIERFLKSGGEIQKIEIGKGVWNEPKTKRSEISIPPPSHITKIKPNVKKLDLCDK
jgi:hypothetical protein